MKATKEQVDGELMVIKLFASNYAGDLYYTWLPLLKLKNLNGQIKIHFIDRLLIEFYPLLLFILLKL
jgi:hypothetical protein